MIMQKDAVNTEPCRIFYYWAGRIPFEKSLILQERLKGFAKKSQFCFLGFECLTPVITLGLRADKSHVLWPAQKRKQKKITCLKLKRGGEATLHAPGQLLIYPIVCLPALSLKVRDFIRALEEISQETLWQDYGLKTERGKDFAGLYTERGKISFFGLHISETVSQHGLSINVDNDLSLFEAVKSCGAKRRPHDSLSFYSNAVANKRTLFVKWSDRAFSFFSSLNRRESLAKKRETLFHLISVCRFRASLFNFFGF